MDEDQETKLAVIIEDDADVRHLLKTVLTQTGFQTILTTNGADGIEAVRTHDPILTTLDVSMPGMDGFAAAKRIREFSTTYIVMLTALDDEIDVVQGLDSGADDYLIKPFRPRELRARIETMMRRPRERAGVGTTPAPGDVTPAPQPPFTPVHEPAQPAHHQPPAHEPQHAAYPPAAYEPPPAAYEPPPAAYQPPPAAYEPPPAAYQPPPAAYEPPPAAYQPPPAAYEPPPAAYQPPPAAHQPPQAPPAPAAPRVTRQPVHEPTPSVPAASSAEGWLEHRGLQLNTQTRLTQVDGRGVELTRSEFDLLATLLGSGRRVRSKADLVLALRGESYVTTYYVNDADKRAVEVHMANLRRKIGDSSATPRFIETVRGVGYRLASDREG
jgi:two-component system OmpR family response regulator